MASVDELNQRFGIANVARFETGRGNLTRLAVTAPGGEGHIYLHGAHVTHFQPKGRGPVLFLSSKSFFEEGKAIRGGVPVIFPWFGPNEQHPGVMHGFARTRAWDVIEVAPAGDAVRVVLGLKSDDKTRALWPNEFELRFTATFGATLDMQFEVKNTGPSAFRFEEALHTYFAVGDARAVTIDGLGKTAYLDKNLDHAQFTQEEPTLKLEGPVDRVYLNTTATCAIDDKVNARKIHVAKAHSNATVVWNPWSEKIKSMADLEASEWTQYVCVETCNVKANALDLPAGRSHILRATISVG